MKRKRDVIERRVAEQSYEKDTVFLPPDNEDENVPIPLGKKFVKIEDFNKLKTTSLGKNDHLRTLGDAARKLP